MFEENAEVHFAIVETCVVTCEWLGRRKPMLAEEFRAEAMTSYDISHIQWNGKCKELQEYAERQGDAIADFTHWRIEEAMNA